MKETEEIMGMIKEEGAAYFARERGNKVEVGLYLEHIIEERGMKKKDIVRKLNLEESYARKLFGGQRIPTRKILLQCAFLLSLDLSDTQRLLDIGQKPRLYPRVRYDAAIIYGLEEKMTLEEMNSFLDEIGEMPLLIQAKFLRVIETGKRFYCKIFLKDIPEGILNAVKNEDGSV